MPIDNGFLILAKGARSEVPQRGCPIVMSFIHFNININVYT